MKKILEDIKKALKNVKTALVISHIDPDGDSIGSTLALGAMLDKLGIKATLFCEDGVPRIYRFLNGAEKIKKKLALAEHFHIAFAVDASDEERLGKKVNLREAAKFIVNIDHHPDNALFGDINYVSQRSSAAEMIYRLFKYLKIKMDPGIAEALYVALITDTGNFRYETTSTDTFAMATDLLQAGVKTHALTTKVYDNKSIASLRVCSAALANLELSPDRKIAWTSVSEAMMQKYGARAEDLIGLVDRIRSVEGIEVAILFRQEGNKIKINFRSKEKVDVSAIAACFGGGGHHKAAGAIIEGDADLAKRRVIETVEKFMV